VEAAMMVRRLLIAAVLLAAAGGALWWSNRKEAAKEANPPISDNGPRVVMLNRDDIQQIEIHQREGNVTTVLKKAADGKWSITSPKPFAADENAVSSMATTASNLRAVRLLDENATDLAGYGLDPAAVAVTFTDKAGKTTKLLLGDATPTDNNVYAKLEGDKKLYTVASSSKSDFDKSTKDLRERHLLTVVQEGISRVELNSKSQDIEFGRAGDNWQILKPKPLRADSSQVEEVLRKVKDATLDAEAADKDAAKTASAFAGAQPVATVRVTDTAGTKTLEIRKAKDDCYAKSSTLEGVYKANKDLCEGMDKPLADFRNKKLFEFAFSDPNRVEFTDNGKTVVYEKDKDGWKSGGKAMDSVGIQNLIDKLRDASASKLVDAGFTTPAIEIGVTSKDGELKEKVQIASANGMYFARRENDTTIYQMDPTVVEDIRKAAGGIQPAAPPQGKK
jgi:hypothetical protein